MQKNKKIIFSILFSSALLFAGSAKAVCPVCVVAIGAGLGLSRWLGVDDTISSMWIGALLWALSAWTLIWLKKRNWNFKYDSIIIPVAYYVLVLIPLYFADIIGHPLNKIFGIDKIIFGAALGTVIFFGAMWLHNFLKTKNGGKSFFSYQKVVLPVVVLILTSSLFYLLLKWMTI